MPRPETLAEEWPTRAACRGLDVALFVPDYRAGAAAHQRRIIAAYCDRCPVTTECLEDALTYAWDDQHGVRGGTLAEQRRRILRSRGRK